MVSTQKEEKSQAMFRAWLKYRPVLIFRLSYNTSEAQPQPLKAWNALLAAEYLSMMKPDKQQGTRTEERQALRSEMLSFLGNNLRDLDVQISDNLDVSTEGCLWHGIPFTHLQQEHFEQILWELSEINFRFEFQALDRRGRRGTWYEQDMDADISLMACVPDASFAVPSLTIANHGIASSSQKERAHYIFTIGHVMSRWSWVKSASWIMKTKTKLRWSLDELELLEIEIASQYTQSFHDCFRRAAILPRRLSEAAMKALPSVGEKHLPQQAPVLENVSVIFINIQAAKQHAIR